MPVNFEYRNGVLKINGYAPKLTEDVSSLLSKIICKATEIDALEDELNTLVGNGVNSKPTDE